MMLIKLLRDITEQYNLELVGEDLGNFHVDFDMDGANSEIYAIESLFLGKNTYIFISTYIYIYIYTHIYVLPSTNKEGSTINSEHIRMKGIPTPCIKYYAEQNNINALDVYKQLYDNKTMKFDLTNDGNKFVCRNNKDYTVNNVSYFTRTCQYIRAGNDKTFINIILFLIIHNNG